jgi:simple sugar transport system permease protein
VLGLALIIGLSNGLVTVRIGLPSFITTMGMMMFLRGVVYAVTRGFPVSIEGNDLFRQVLAGRFVERFSISSVWLVIICLVFTIILTRTRYGNWVFAVGGSKNTAKAMGINVNKVKLLNFMLCSLLASFAGIIAFARLGMIAPTSGTGMELEAIASAVVGGCLLTGGYGSIVGAFMGAFMIAMLRVGLVLAGAPTYYYSAFIGIILVIASAIHLTIRRRTLG